MSFEVVFLCFAGFRGLESSAGRDLQLRGHLHFRASCQAVRDAELLDVLGGLHGLPRALPSDHVLRRLSQEASVEPHFSGESLIWCC